MNALMSSSAGTVRMHLLRAAVVDGKYWDRILQPIGLLELSFNTQEEGSAFITSQQTQDMRLRHVLTVS